jgi:hypothetical protein
MKLTPEQAAMKHHFLAPLVVQAFYADPEMQARYDIARWELEK